MKEQTEPTREAVIRQLVSHQKKAIANLDKLCDLQNRRARMDGEKPPHPSKAKRDATGYVADHFGLKGSLIEDAASE